MTEQISWTARAKKLVEYHDEAVDFVGRAAQQGLPSMPEDARAVAHLWLESELLDRTACGLLDQVNTDLLADEGEMDATRGASMHNSVMDEQYLAYECSWTLEWEGKGIAVVLSVDPRTGGYEAQCLGVHSGEVVSLRFPIADAEIQDALTETYVAETVSGRDSRP